MDYGLQLLNWADIFQLRILQPAVLQNKKKSIIFVDDFMDGPNKELNSPGSRIPKDLQENYIRELIHSWINQYENLNEN